ncbi:hypothetical protein AB6A40_010817 [Gnathostoma spinigerum]|uniref:PHR domain-containing protein n=1 Tax=Gnathostoma spinigerum TaxID=75299 RepID=A0ABD6EWF9_9BILA
MAEVSVQIKDCCGVIRDIVNFFFMPSADSKNGTGVQGGQIPEIIFYA